MTVLTNKANRSTTRRTTTKTAVLPTNLTTKKYPIHRWFNFVAGFSPEFVDTCIENLPAKMPNVLLDPFTGCGTAQVEGIRNGMKVFGYEAHPFFARIAKAKTHGSNQEDLNAIQSRIEQGFKNPTSLETLPESAKAYLEKLYDHDSLEKLLGARNYLQHGGNSELGYLVLSKILDHVSHSKTDGIYKAPTSRKQGKTPEDALGQVMDMLREDLENYKSMGEDGAKIFNKSSESMEELHTGSVGLIVTSPPYLNNFDFAEMTRHYLYFWGEASTWSEISDLVRSKQIVNTTTALKGHKTLQDHYKNELPHQIQAELTTIVTELTAQKKIRPGKKEYDFLVYPYFAQMQRVLNESLRVLCKRGQFHMMVSDAALYGVHIPAPQVLEKIMIELGYSNVNCTKVRDRGHRWILKKRDGSPIGLGEYHIFAEKK